MKIAITTAAVMAGLTFTASLASADDVKNVPGAVCIRYSASEAPKSSEYVTSVGQLCNDSSTQRLRVLCPVTQDLGTDESVSMTFDYVNWNPDGINGHQNSHPDDEFLCSVFTRTRYGAGYYWGTWKSAADFPGWGATPTAMYASAAMLDDGSTHGVCYIPRKTSYGRSCVSHLKYNEQ